jgi:hypothetical protein
MRRLSPDTNVAADYSPGQGVVPLWQGHRRAGDAHSFDSTVAPQSLHTKCE